MSNRYLGKHLCQTCLLKNCRVYSQFASFCACQAKVTVIFFNNVRNRHFPLAGVTYILVLPLVLLFNTNFNATLVRFGCFIEIIFFNAVSFSVKQDNRFCLFICLNEGSWEAKKTRNDRSIDRIK